jgi:hypothetical protein
MASRAEERSLRRLFDAVADEYRTPLLRAYPSFGNPADRATAVSKSGMMRLLLIAAIVAPVMAQTQTPADKVVAELRTLPAPLPRPMGSEGPVIESEVTRRRLYEELRQLRAEALPALARGLRDPDLRLRRNVALALGALGGTWWDRAKMPLDISPLLADLVRALKDEDSFVRNWSAQAIGNIGSEAGPAVPALVALLKKEEESRISVCGALRQIGSPARAAYRAC